MKIFLLMLAFFPAVLAGQGKYKHIYKIHLKDQPSNYSIQIADTLIEGGKSLLCFISLDYKGDTVSNVNLTIDDSKTKKLIYSDMNGLASVMLSSDTFDISITSPFYTPIRINKKFIKNNSKIILKTSLGRSNAKMIGNINSKRKLTESEISKIVEDLSMDLPVELIKNKTCYVLWEI